MLNGPRIFNHAQQAHSSLGGGFAGDGGGLQALASAPNGPGGPMQPIRQGYYDYLQGLGYTGEMGAGMHQFAQGLRADGQTPWKDYRQSDAFPGWGSVFGQGQVPGHWGQGNGGSGPQGNWGSAYQNPTQGRPMNPQGIAVGEPNGSAYGALGSFADALRKRNPMIAK